MTEPRDPLDDLPPAPMPGGGPVPVKAAHDGTNNGKSATRFRIRNRRRTVASLVLARVEEHEIALSLGVSRDTVKKDKAILAARWEAAAQRDIGEARAEAAAALDADEVRLRDFAQRLEKKGDVEGALEAFDRILKIHERRARLLGLDSPEQKEIRFPATWKTGVLRDEARPLDHVADVLAVLAAVGALPVGERIVLPVPDALPDLARPEHALPAGTAPAAAADEVRADDSHGETGRVSMDHEP